MDFRAKWKIKNNLVAGITDIETKAYKEEPEIKALSKKSQLRTSANYKTIAKGEKIYEAYTDEQKDKLFSLEGTIHFVTLLGLGATKSGLLKSSDGIVKYAIKVVGVTLKTDIDIEVPVISVLKNIKTGINPEDVSSRRIKAGDSFNLNMLEVMLFITKPEYGGYITRDGDTRGVHLSARTNNYYSGKDKLPSPGLIARPGTGALRESTVEIDEQISPSFRAIKAEYQEEFGALLKKPKKRVKPASKPVGEVSSSAITDILKNILG